ncbi:TetR/AcrR family transcriptional regulator, partial [Fodinicola feengrottensis]|uniref:TetR/AcrR family transcriptional regulator n=1 Tax=Fodinicola feengrottensis TaxID=435914 RepID=UPI002442C228
MQHRGTFIEQARRAQMVQCAVEEIAENGYPAASLAAIARRAGVSRGVISYHFADKDDLVEQVIADFYRHLVESVPLRQTVLVTTTPVRTAGSYQAGRIRSRDPDSGISSKPATSSRTGPCSELRNPTRPVTGPPAAGRRKVSAGGRLRQTVLVTTTSSKACR